MSASAEYRAGQISAEEYAEAIAYDEFWAEPDEDEEESEDY